MKIVYAFTGLIVIGCGIVSIMCENTEIGTGFLIVGSIISILGFNNENTDSSTTNNNPSIRGGG
jgi:hypothetical protein